MLTRVPQQETSDLEEAIQVVSGKFAPHRLQPESSQLRLSMRSTTFGDLSVHVMDYGSSVVVDSTMLEDTYLLCIPTAGASEVAFGSTSWTSTPGAPALLPPDREFTLTWEDPTPQLVVAIPKERLESVSRGMFPGEPASAEFPVFDLRSSEGQSFATEVVALYGAANTEVPALSHGLARSFTDVFVARLLSAVYANVEGTSAGSTVSGHKIATAFLRLATTRADISPVSAAAELGVPLRTLQNIVKEGLNVTPTQAIQHARLERARELLRRSNPTTTTVTNVASECGFHHAGRFSVRYREAFGEMPSETLRRG